MHLVNVRFNVKPELADEFPAAIADLIAATRDEPGNLWYELARNTDDPSEFYVLEGYTDEGFAAHAQSEHFKSGGAKIAPFLTRAPEVIARQVDGDGWDKLGLPAGA